MKEAVKPPNPPLTLTLPYSGYVDDRGRAYIRFGVKLVEVHASSGRAQLQRKEMPNVFSRNRINAAAQVFIKTTFNQRKIHRRAQDFTMEGVHV